MSTNLLPLTAAIVMFAALLGAAHSQQPVPVDVGPGITAEVRGTLRFDKGNNIHLIVMPPDARGGNPTRVWLLRGEDKNRQLDEKLDRLDGKEVVAKGKLAQMPENVQSARVPPLGLYLDNHFTIEAATAK
jgi:hypothetical protein